MRASRRAPWLALAALAALAQPAAAQTVRSYDACLALVDRDPGAGREAASEWIRFGGAGLPGRICEAMALSALGANGSAAAALDLAARETPPGTLGAAALWATAAEFWLADGSLIEAAASADAALAAAPEGAAVRGDALRIRGMARLGAGQDAAAAIDLGGALGFEAQQARATLWAARARARNRLDDPAGAEADAAEALSRAPDLPAAWLERGRAAFAEGRARDGREALLRAIEADGPAPGGAVSAEARGLIQSRALRD